MVENAIEMTIPSNSPFFENVVYFYPETHTPVRQTPLVTGGFVPDVHFGNYVRRDALGIMHACNGT